MKTLRFLAIMLTALSMGTAYAHLLEMPAKLNYDGETWLQLLQTLYPPAFGTVGGASEIGAVIATIVLVLMIRKRRDAFRWSILAAACLIGSHAIYWIFIAPVNATLVPLTAETLPENW